MRLNFLESLEEVSSMDVKGESVCIEMETVLTRIWVRWMLGTGEGRSHEEIQESEGLVKVFA